MRGGGNNLVLVFINPDYRKTTYNDPINPMCPIYQPLITTGTDTNFA